VNIEELNVGDWFRSKGGCFIKTAPFLRGQTHYQAISLTDGSPAFPVRSSTAPGTFPVLPSDEVTAIEKPSSIR